MNILTDNQITPTSNYFEDRRAREINSEKIKLLPGHSLFNQVPSRSCSEAEIPEFICLCGINPSIGTDHLNNKNIHNAAKFMVEYINNNILRDQNMCVKRKFLRIKSAKAVGQSQKYSIVIEVTPDNSVFDGLVKIIEKNSKTMFEVIGKINRISLYDDTADCIENNFLKNYCFCK